MQRLTPFIYLALAVASLLVPILVVVANPSNSALFIIVVPGMGLAILFGAAFFNRFSLKEEPRMVVRKEVEFDYAPSRVRCHYCGTMQPPGDKCISCGAVLPESGPEKQEDEAVEDYRKENPG